MIAVALALALVPDPPAQVVARYVAALAAYKPPRVFVVEYTLEQSGTRNIEQRHRIFRSGNLERDETIAVNGTTAPRPDVRIFRGRPDRYAVGALAPRPSSYAFTYVGPHRDGRHLDYVFRVTPRGDPAFSFTSVTIDGLTALPDAVTFRSRAPGGTGAVTFAKVERYWVAATAMASARIGKSVAAEQLAFSHWGFPRRLPASTFATPRPAPSPGAAG